jgi:hypothetical protein
MGMMLFPNGNIYSGKFENAKMEGKGMYFYLHGDTCCGVWKNDKRTGKSISILANGYGIIIEWKDGEMIKGKGIAILPSGNLIYESDIL